MNIERGFTLIESMFFLAALAVLASFTRADIEATRVQSMIDATANSVFALRMASLNYHDSEGDWPSSLQALEDWLGDEVALRERNPFGFDYTLHAPSSDEADAAPLRIATALGTAERAGNLANLLGVWASVNEDSVDLRVLPTHSGILASSQPYRFDSNLMMGNHAIQNLGHLRLHNNGAGVTLIVDKVFVGHFVADDIYTRKFRERKIWGWRSLSGEPIIVARGGIKYP